MGRRSSLKRLARVEKINNFFDLEIRNIERSGRQIELDTTKGSMKFSPTDRDEGFLIFLFSAQQHLQANGFKQFKAIHQSSNAYPYIKYRGMTLVLEDKVEGVPFTYTAENIKKALEMLAKFHKAARKLNPMPGSEFKVSWGKWPDRCFAEVNEMVRKKLELKDDRSTEFDDKFWEQVDHLIERGLMAWQRFNHENYRKVLKEEMEDRAFNLHSFKADNLMLVDGEVMIKSMDRIRFETQVYDLAVFFDEVLKNTDLKPTDLAKCIHTYTNIRPLSQEEREALVAFLLYPKGLYRLIRHYYRNRRVRDGMKRFEDFIQLMEREEELVEHLEVELGE